MNDDSLRSNDSLLRQQALVLFAGFIVGIAAAYGISLLSLSDGSDLAAARRLGIVSLTILAGHSKTGDIYNYLALITLPPGFSMAAWYFWSRGDRYARLCLLSDDSGLPDRPLPPWLLVVAGFAILLFSFNINYFYKPIVGWTFLGEEGVNLAAVASILDGGVYSRDFTNCYGPMLLYPLALLMKVIGATVLTDRIYTYLLNLAAYGIIGLFFYRTIRSRLVFVLATLSFFAIFHPFIAVSPNTTYLRVALGLLTLLIANRYMASGSRYLLWAAGIAAGQSLLFSQEVGICAIASLLVVFFVKNLPQREFRTFGAEILQLGAACLVSIAPMLLYFAYQGALASFLFELLYYPQLYAMGAGLLKFPSLATLFSEPIAGQALFPYWLILVYLLTALHLLPLLAMGRMTARNLAALSLLVFGIILYRSALSRPDLYHLFFASPPALILFFLLLDRAASTGNSLASLCSPVWKTGKIAALAVLIAVLFLVPELRNYTLVNSVKYGLDFREKWSRLESGYQLLPARTGGVPVGEELVDSIAKIADFLARTTVPGEYVYFFPNEGGYYFLFGRKNPSRYALAYQAITAEQRREIIRDLETKKPRFVIYSRRVWLVDNIQPGVQVPELVHYLNEKYTPFQDMDEILIMKRIGL